MTNPDGERVLEAMRKEVDFPRVWTRTMTKREASEAKARRILRAALEAAGVDGRSTLAVDNMLYIVREEIAAGRIVAKDAGHTGRAVKGLRALLDAAYADGEESR